MRRLPTKSIFSQSGIRCGVVPMNRAFSNQLNRARRTSSARVAKTAVSSETPVPRSSMKANPRTPAVATANRTRAVIAVTTFASRIVVKPFV